MKYITLAIWFLFIVSCTGGSKRSGLKSVISGTDNPDLKKIITLAEGMSGTQEADALLYLLSNMEYKTSLISAESGKGKHGENDPFPAVKRRIKENSLLKTAS